MELSKLNLNRPGNVREIICNDLPILVRQYRAAGDCGQKILTVPAEILDLFCESVLRIHDQDSFSELSERDNPRS